MMARAKRHPLLLTAGELLRIARLEAVELDEAQRLGDAARALRPADPPHAQAKGDVLGDGQMREQREVLEHHAEIAAIGRRLRHVAAADEDVALGGELEARDEAQGRRLAATRGAEQREEEAARDCKAESRTARTVP